MTISNEYLIRLPGGHMTISNEEYLFRLPGGHMTISNEYLYGCRVAI